MSSAKYNAPITVATFIVLGVSVITFTPLLFISSSRAQLSSNEKELTQAQNEFRTTTSHHLILPVGTQIPIRYDRAEKILLTKEETMAITLKVSTDILNSHGTIVIPDGSEIVGEIKPTGKGSQFFSHKILIKSENQIYLEQSLDAISQVITKFETLIKGVDFDEILKGAIVGQKAEKLIASFKEYNRNRRGELDSAALEALAGWFLGSETLELLSINTEKDLDLTLRSELVLK